MNVDVCVPFRGGEPHRERNFEYVHKWWVDRDFRVHVADGGPGPMNRSRARNQAAKQATSDVLVFADADTIPDLELTEQACLHAAKTGELTYPFTRLVGLSPGATVGYMETGAVGAVVKRAKNSPGGVLAVHRDLYEWAGRYDERFEGWGYEDLAFAMAARTLGGIHRYEGVAIHLWHPTSPERRDAIRYRTANRALRDEYGQADGDPTAMRELVGSRNEG